MSKHSSIDIARRCACSPMAVGATIELSRLAYVRDAGLDSSKACLAGTRMKTLEDLSGWINGTASPQVRFLFGGAGTGKSAVAHSIGERFESLGRLGSFFQFDRTAQRERPLASVIRTIANDLANWSPDFRRALAKVLHDKGYLVGSIDIAKQWEGLILEPLKDIAFVGPVLVVLDAFDESSSMDAPLRHQLLRSLTEGSKQLPPNFRLLITSRPEHDVMSAVDGPVQDIPHISHMLLDNNKEEATTDIELYVRHQLTSDGPESRGALGDEDYRLLSAKAEGLFQWAATACRSILEKPAGRTLKERWALFCEEGHLPLTTSTEESDRKSTRLNSSHSGESRMPSSA